MSENEFASYREPEIIFPERGGEVSVDKTKEAKTFLGQKHLEALAFDEVRETLIDFNFLPDEAGDMDAAEQLRAILAGYGLEDKFPQYREWLERFIERQLAVETFCAEQFDNLADEGRAGDLPEFDRRVCFKLFNFAPAGLVEVESLPTALLFCFHSKDDFNQAFQTAAGVKTVSDTLHGFKWIYHDEDGFTVSVIGEKIAPDRRNTEDLRTRRHEEAHVWNDAVFGVGSDHGEPWSSFNAVLRTGDEAAIQQQLEPLSEAFADKMLWRAADEMLSVLRGGHYEAYVASAALTELVGAYDYYHGRDGYDIVVLPWLDKNEGLSPESRVVLKDNLCAELETWYPYHNDMVKSLLEIMGTVRGQMNISDHELYLWLATEAAGAENIDEVIVNWRKVADAVSVSYAAKAASRRATAA